MKTEIQNPIVLSILLADEPAAHERLASVLRRRVAGNVETSTVRGEEKGMARVTVIVDASEAGFVHGQIEKLVDVVEVIRLATHDYVGIQLALIRIEAAGAEQDEASDVLSAAGARLLRLSPSWLVAEVADTPEAVDRLISQLTECGPVSAIRTGLVAMRL